MNYVQLTLDESTIGEIAFVHAKSLRDTYSDIDSRLVGDTVTIERYWKKVAQGQYVVDAAYHEGVMVGFATATPSRFTKNDAWEIRALYILLSYRNKGIGRVLFYNTIQKLTIMNIQYVDILVHAWNTQALAFFSAMGANSVGDQSVEIEIGSVQTKLLRKALHHL